MNDQAEAVQETQVEQTEVAPESQTPESTPTEKVESPDQATEASQEETTTQEGEKTFTQSQLDEIIQKRIKKAESIAERRALKAYAEKLEALQKKPVEQEQAKVNDGMPDIATYGEDVNKYVKDMVGWELQKEREKTYLQEQEIVNRIRHEKATKLYAAAEKMQGFDAEAFEEILTPSIASAILDSDVATKLMVYFSDNQEDAIRIGTLSPARQAAEIGKLEVKLSAAKKVTVSNAPAPMKPVGSKGGQVHKPVGEMSLAELRKFEETRGSKFI